MLNGILTSKVEIVQVSPFGIWLDINDREYFLDSENYPWFADATLKEIYHVETDKMGNLHWPDLDIDIEMDSLNQHDAYPLIYHKGSLNVIKY